MAQLARDAESILNDSTLGPRYRECVEHAGQSPKHLAARFQIEVGPKMDHAISALAAGYIDEADIWITWAAKLDPARSDLRLHRSFLGFCRASSEHKKAVAAALREMLAEETIKAPSDICLQVYLACVACHQPDGKGLPKAFPPLAGSKRLLGPVDLPTRIILKGLQGPLKAGDKHYNGMMPGHEGLLTDLQIADVLNYTRSAWGNQAGEVSEESVGAVRATVARRTSPWTEPELRSKK